MEVILFRQQSLKKLLGYKIYSLKSDCLQGLLEIHLKPVLV